MSSHAVILLGLLAAAGTPARKETKNQTPDLQVLISGISTTGSLAVDRRWVYVSTGGSILAVPKTGGEPVTLATDQTDPHKVKFDATHVYWLVDQGIRRIKKNAKPADLPEKVYDERLMFLDLSIGNTFIYYACNPDYGLVRQHKKYRWREPIVQRRKRKGRIQVVLRFVFDHGTLYWIDYDEIRGNLTPENDKKEFLVVKIAEGRLWNFAVSRKFIYYVEARSINRLWRIPKAGGEAVLIDERIGRDIVADGRHIYWAARDAIHRKPHGSGESRVFAKDQVRAWSLELDDTHVYWSADVPGQEPGEKNLIRRQVLRKRK